LPICPRIEPAEFGQLGSWTIGAVRAIWRRSGFRSGRRL